MISIIIIVKNDRQIVHVLSELRNIRKPDKVEVLVVDASTTRTSTLSGLRIFLSSDKTCTIRLSFLTIIIIDIICNYFFSPPAYITFQVALYDLIYRKSFLRIFLPANSCVPIFFYFQLFLRLHLPYDHNFQILLKNLFHYL